MDLFFFSLDSARDDEHRLIARYAAKLAQESRTGMVRWIYYYSYFCLTVTLACYFMSPLTVKQY